MEKVLPSRQNRLENSSPPLSHCRAQGLGSTHYEPSVTKKLIADQRGYGKVNTRFQALTTSPPSTFTGISGSGLWAGPAITAAPSAGSKTDPWHGQARLPSL